MPDLTILQNPWALGVLISALAMLFVKTRMRAMVMTALFGAILTGVIVFQTMDVETSVDASPFAVAAMIWPLAALVYVLAYLAGAFLRWAFRIFKPIFKPTSKDAGTLA